MAVETPELKDSLDFSGNVALVTGGSRGIGAGIARRFAEAGASVVVNYVRGEVQAQEVVEDIQGRGLQALAVQADVTQAPDVERLISRSIDYFGRLDVLVNNAGIYPLSPLLQMTDDEWNEVLAANLTGTHYCCQRFARTIEDRASQSGAGGGNAAIVNVSSIEASSTAFSHVHYTAAKAAVEQYTRNAALELAGHSIRVNAVAPGLIDRPGLAQDWPEGVQRWQARAPLARLGTAQDIADACIFLASPLARWITGVTLAVDGGILLAPAF